MIYSATIGSKHLYRDFGVYVKTKVINMPEVQVNTLEIPCRDGLIDLSEVLRGEPTYKNRAITISCKLLGRYENFYKVISDLGNYLHGRTMRIVFDDDVDYYYVGRVQIVGASVNSNNCSFELSCDCEPYKHLNVASDEPWLWDTFDFVSGYINDLYIILKPHDTYEAYYRLTLDTDVKIIINSNVAVQCQLKNGTTIEIAAGETQKYSSELGFNKGVNNLIWTNNSDTDAIIKLKWDEMRL